MKEYKIRHVKMIINYSWSALIIALGFKVLQLLLGEFSKANEESKLLWVIIICLFGFAWRIPIPNFESYIITYEGQE